MSDNEFIPTVLDGMKRDKEQYATLLAAADQFIKNIRSQPFPAAADNFSVDSEGRIHIRFLGLSVKAEPALVRADVDTTLLFLKWSFHVDQVHKNKPLWDFFLSVNGRIQETRLNGFNERRLYRIADSEDKNLPELIIASVYKAFIESDFLAP